MIESSQTLADGNHISSSHTNHVYRDGEGRTRRETEGTMTAVSRTQPVVSTKQLIISITDPVAGFSYSLDTEHKIAWRTPMVSIDKIEAELDFTAAKMKADGNPPTTAQDKEKLAAEKAAGEEKLKVEAARVGADGVVTRDGGGGGFGGAVVGGRGGSVGVARGDTRPLEHKTIDGLAVEGHKTTTVIPAGAVGNDDPSPSRRKSGRRRTSRGCWC